jgi:hypothetical protein
VAPPSPARDRFALDRLALKHWPRGHRVLVCSLTGGTGRTTVAALLASTLAGLPFAHIWPPALLVATTRAYRHLGRAGESGDTPTAPPGIAVLQPDDVSWPAGSGRRLRRAVTTVQDRYAPVIIDSLSGLPSESPWTHNAPAGFSVVLVVRPDEYSLTDAAEVLVWLHNQQLVGKQQVIVVVNHGAGPPTGRTRPTAAALAVRCHGLHHLPAHPHLGPSPVPATARPVPARLRLRFAQICLDIWHTSQTPTQHDPLAAGDHPQELA